MSPGHHQTCISPLQPLKGVRKGAGIQLDQAVLCTGLTTQQVSDTKNIFAWAHLR